MNIYTPNFRLALVETLSHEGGYSDNPKDPGGVTMRGVTKATYARWTGRRVRDVPDDEMRSLSIEKVMPIYHAWYWEAVQGDRLPGGLDFLIFDIAVNSGPARAVRMLQKAINSLSRIKVQVDGVMGPKTLSAASKINVFDLINEVGNTRLWFYFDLSTFRTFGRGWMRRLLSVTSFATAMALNRAEVMVMARAGQVVPELKLAA
ncbi:MAG: glycoside hydrolase family 108 protein [Rhodobacterales bacterium]|nr:glycoside hydrolase family 108 protein [Rhodobacterales bacterium]